MRTNPTGLSLPKIFFVAFDVKFETLFIFELLVAYMTFGCIVILLAMEIELGYTIGFKWAVITVVGFVFVDSGLRFYHVTVDEVVWIVVNPRLFERMD